MRRNEIVVEWDGGELGASLFSCPLLRKTLADQGNTELF